VGRPASGRGGLPSVPKFSAAVETNFAVAPEEDNKEKVLWVVVDFIILILTLLVLVLLVNELLTLNNSPLFSRPSFLNDLPVLIGK
jgi:hypothetical protein